MLFRRNCLPKTEESVFGRSCFVLGAAYFAAEIFMSLLVGPITELLQTTTAIVAIATVFGGLGVAVSLLVKVPQ